jgi:hypothetical protein
LRQRLQAHLIRQCSKVAPFQQDAYAGSALARTRSRLQLTLKGTSSPPVMPVPPTARPPQYSKVRSEIAQSRSREKRAPSAGDDGLLGRGPTGPPARRSGYPPATAQASLDGLARPRRYRQAERCPHLRVPALVRLAASTSWARYQLGQPTPAIAAHGCATKC